ncbi:hypothetical protein KUTeg_013052, partial [Tegillarca granosa]
MYFLPHNSITFCKIDIKNLVLFFKKYLKVNLLFSVILIVELSLIDGNHLQNCSLLLISNKMYDLTFVKVLFCSAIIFIDFLLFILLIYKNRLLIFYKLTQAIFDCHFLKMLKLSVQLLRILTIFRLDSCSYK